MKVGVTDVETFDDLLDPVVDTRMQAEGQPVAARVNVVNYLVDIARFKTRHVQDRAEDFARHIGDTVYLDDCR